MLKLKEVIVSILALVFMTGWGSYERIGCLSDDEQLPIYRIRVESEKPGWATAVIVAPGYALTAAHVVRGDLKSISVLTPKGPRAASRAVLDRRNDLALLSLDTTGLSTMPITDSALPVGTTLWTAGFRGEEGITFKGPLIQLKAGYIIVGAPVFPGMSGGPVVACEDGRAMVAGIIISFNSRTIRRWRSIDDTGTIIHEFVVNDGSTNAPGGGITYVFTQYAIELYESREKEQE